MEPTICALCLAPRDVPISLAATHLVHPEHRKPHVFDIRSEAICPTCGTRWRGALWGRARDCLARRVKQRRLRILASVGSPDTDAAAVAFVELIRRMPATLLVQ